MYKSFYQMRSEAFGSLPVLNLFFNSKSHQDGWRYLVSGITAREPFLLVTGDYGMGKTMLCLILVRLIEKKKNIPLVYLPTPMLSFEKIINTLAERLGINVPLNAVDHTLAALCSYYKNRSVSQEAYIIIDDAQELAVPTLASLRGLANFNHNGFFPFRVVFFAHTSFSALLKTGPLIALDQRIKRRHQLQPFDFQGTKEYIYFRLYKSCAPGTLSFTEDAIHEIHVASKGIPRLINNLCDGCLIRGAERMERTITRATARETIAAEGNIFAAAPCQEPAVFSSRIHVAGMPPAAHEEPVELQTPLCVKEHAPDIQTNVQTTALSDEISLPPKASRLSFATTAFILFAALCIMFAFMIKFDYFPSPPEKPVEITETQASIAQNPPPPEAQEDNKSSNDAAALQAPAPLLVSEPSPVTSTEPAESVPVQPLPAIMPDDTGDDNTTSMAPTEKLALEISRPYTLRLSCFRSFDDIKNATDYYRRRGLSPLVVKVNLDQRGIWWIFYLGCYLEKSDAIQARILYNLPDAYIKKMPYTVDIGLFASEDALQETTARLEQLGFTPYGRAQPDGSFRIYSGAFMYRSGAEQQRFRLTAAGIPSQIAFLLPDNATLQGTQGQ